MRTLERRWDLPVIAFLVVLIVGAAVRLCFADANSYWLDELYSVTVYGTANETISGAMNRVTRSVQLPLYYFVLYIWMAIFGDSEIATRSLSNLFIIGATICLFLTIRKLYGPWLGVIVSLVFTLMFTTTYYGMETRGYAQSIFLTSLSTLILTYALPCLANRSWRLLVRNGWVYALLATNFALLMTHYYNALFLATQSLFIAIYLLYRNKTGNINGLLKAFVVSIAPVITLIVIWAPFILATYRRNARKYVVDGLPDVPWEMLSKLVISPNFGHHYVYALILILITAITVVTTIRLVKRPVEQTLFTFWFCLAVLAPILIAFTLFTISGHQRYSARYFSFCAGPLAVLVVLAIYETLTLLCRTVQVVKPSIVLSLTAAIGGAFAFPGGLDALQKPKDDWRGIAKAIVSRINSEPNKSFAVYETTFKNFPTLNYYLSRYSNDIRVSSVLQKGKEKLPVPVEFTPLDEDYAIVAFTHHTSEKFPKTLRAVNDKMTLLEDHLDQDGYGYLVFKPR